MTPSFGSQEHREVAREAVRKSLVLLKNDDSVLPLDGTRASWWRARTPITRSPVRRLYRRLAGHVGQ